jgi:beta-N-acetylhexosaminidase
MGGILKFFSIEEAAIAAIRAGMDLLEVCHSPELILRAYESLITEAERSTSFRNLLLARATETARKRVRLFTQTESKPLTTAQFESLRKRILRFAEQITKTQPATQEHSA